MVDVKRTLGYLVILLVTILIVIPMAGAGSDNADAFVILENAAPTITPLHEINDTSPQTNDTISCSNGTYYDFNGDPFGGQEWRWKDGVVEIGGETSQTLSLSISGLDKGDNITCESRVNDTESWSNWLSSSNTATIANTAPEITNTLLYPDPITSIQTAYCNWTYYDVDSDSESDTLVEWYVGAIQVKTQNYTGSWPTLSSTYFTRDDIITCSIKGRDGTDYSSAYVNDTIPVQNSAPTFSSISLLPNPAGKERTLTCALSGRADSDGDGMTNYYKFVDTDNVTLLQDWGTATTLNCGLNVQCQKGDTITCIGKVSDGTANSTEQNTSTQIINTVPEAQSVYVFPYSPDTTIDLDCRHTFYDIDISDTEQAVYYQWYLNGTSTGNTSRYLNKSHLNQGDYWKCGIIVNDGIAHSTLVQSTQVIIDSNNPTDIIIANDGIVDEDESISFTWTWNDPQLPFGNPYTHYACSTDNISLTGCADETYCSVSDDTSPSSCSFIPNASVSSSATAYIMVIDGTNLTSPIEPSSFTFNHRPTAENIRLNVTSNTNFNTYTCLLTGQNDSDNDTVSSYYAFYDFEDNVLQSYSGTNTFIVNNGEGTHGNEVTCRAKSYDDRIYSLEQNSTGHFRIHTIEYSSTRIVNQLMTISTSITNTSSINGVNISVKSPFNVLYSGLSMTYDNTTGKWEYDFYPNVVGDWEVYSIYSTQDDNHGYAFFGDFDTFSVSASAPEQPSGGGGGTSTIKIHEVTTVTNISNYCGDGVCGQGENPANCWEDCRVNYDTMITCIYDESIECNWSQTWFPMALIVMLMGIGTVSIYFYEFRGKKRGR